ncbi:sensor domain-containing diguanylate cyclase [Candidatus Solirubrobacter pratensis]|uniref:sensor domain-containing diguanylate cyclase n=1 Tax=Candidatus Solirubrobacter pratensis TaxID=1298857 RepID=UPI0004249E79|nr:diguanylate cyclase [Candidatus Solirubrobacter pratensis]
MDTSAIQAAAAATSATYRSFADATRSVLDLLERHMPSAGLYLAHLDRGQFIHRIVDARNGMEYGLRSNQAMPLGDAFDSHMAEDRATRRTGDVATDPTYAGLPMQQRVTARSYMGVPLELSDGTRVGSLSALSRDRDAFTSADEQLFTMLARVLASELERESNERDLKRFNDLLRDQARGMGAIGRVAKALAGADDARTAICEAACEVMDAPVAFLLEPSGRDFASTAMAGISVQPVTIQPRGDGTGGGRAFTAKEAYFVADARNHPALAAPLVEATSARSAVFEPVLRDGEIAGVLIVIWQAPVDALPEAPSAVLRLVAAQAAVAIEHAGLRAKMQALALSDPLTGLVTRRVFEEELPREVARARRSESPLSVAVVDLDHMSAFNMLRGEREGDRLVKETAARWRGELREVDLLARLEGVEFALVLPSCGLGEAVDVVDRVRASTPRGQTASAGVARWDGEEPAELLLARARDALAAAKSSGRNVTIAAE